MTGLAKELLANANLSLWPSSSVLETWEATATTAATLKRIKETDTIEMGRFATFPTKPYIYDGGSSARVTLTAAAAAGGFIRRQPDASAVGISVQPTERFTAVVAARCSVPGNLARIQVIGLVGTTDTYYLEPVGNTATNAAFLNASQRFTWNTSARNIDCTLSDLWQLFGMPFEIPTGMASIAIRFGNGSAGAQVIDFGYCGFRPIRRVRVA